VRTDTGACATRAGSDEARCRLIGSPLATASLFDQAGKSVAALECLEAGGENLPCIRPQQEAAWTASRQDPIDRILDYLRTRSAKRETGT
jgi:hypothetical protein